MATQRFPRLPVKGPVVIPNGAQVKFKWLLDGQPCSNVQHGSILVGPVAPGIAETIMQSLLSAAGFTAWLGKISPTTTFVGVEVKDLRTAYQPTLVNTTLTSVPGTSVGTHGAGNAAVVVTERTAQSGKGFVGRVYLLGVTNDNWSDSRHFAATLNPFAGNLVTAMHTAMSAGGITWGIGQRALQANATPGAPPNLAVARPASIIPGVSVAVIDQRIDSQRRRLGKH
jgi:hypothetical protein